MADRRRANGTISGTTPPLFVSELVVRDPLLSQRPVRERGPQDLRKIFLKTGLTPSASGSAYLEIEQASSRRANSLIPLPSTLKLTCSVHGPRPLPRSACFTPHMLLSTHVKFAPFATRRRRGYLRDAGERDLAVHLETALRGVIISDRWPKSGMEVIITVLEGEEDQWWGDEAGFGNDTTGDAASAMMSILSGCITVASAAIIDAGIDCVDIVSGGVAALVSSNLKGATGEDLDFEVVLDPAPAEHERVIASCAVGFLKSREEVTELWIKGSVPSGMRSKCSPLDLLIDGAVQAATASSLVIREAVKEITAKDSHP